MIAKIVLLNSSPTEIADLQTASPQACIVNATDETVLEELADADAFIGSITPGQVAAGKRLRWVQVWSAGVDRLLFGEGGEAFRNSSIVLTNNRIVQGPEVSDHALALLLMLTRKLYIYYANQKREVWDDNIGSPIELRSKTAVVVGVGGIGTQIALRLNAFGMTVTGVDPEDKPFLPFVDRFVKPTELDALLPLADVLLLSAPLTPATRKMIGPRQFGLMKQGAIFIAVSRGALYDLDSLVEALREGRLAGAGVDVTDPEPLPAGHPLWQLPNAIVTPHIAVWSDRDYERRVAIVKENIRRFAEGQPLIHVVDKQKGY
jgi:phosphoglycerate dehydrogenase-like enzyme